MPPQFSSGTLFPHPRRSYADGASCLRQSVLNSSTARLPADHLRCAAHKTGLTGCRLTAAAFIQFSTAHRQKLSYRLRIDLLLRVTIAPHTMRA